ncbi:MAG: hypothetical protein ACYTAS_05460 [Planctomycetota bacterium]|jgi:predicted nucleotidyltransferase
MITEEQREIILHYAREYQVDEVVLFGSSLDPAEAPHDVDLAVKGIDPARFFRFYADLVKHLSPPVDLVDLSRKSLFNDLIRETGLRIYDGADQEDRGREGERRASSSLSR